MLELKNISANYGANRVLQNLSLRVGAGEVVALLGASGCGKSTILKVAAGLVAPENGEVWFDDEDFTNIAAERRGAVLMFQKPLLFPYLSVAENVGFGLKMRRMPKAEIAAKVSEALKLVQLENFETRRPKHLSGGQEQRVSLARALVTNPRVLLLDEPFTALDTNLRIEMRRLVRDLQQKLKITTIFVTHDQTEAVAVADRIALMNAGQIEQFDFPREFFVNPQTAHAARFFGWKVWKGIQNGNSIETAIGNFQAVENRKWEIENSFVGFHPANAKIVEKSQNGFNGIVEAAIDLGARRRFVVRLSDGETVEIETTENNFTPESGTQISLQIAPEKIKIFA